MRRRSAASASRARVNSFSLASSFSRAASHCCGETIWVFMANLLFVAVLFSAALRGQPLVVFLGQAQPAVPEGTRLLATSARHQHVEMHVPAGGNAQHVVAV